MRDQEHSNLIRVDREGRTRPSAEGERVLRMLFGGKRSVAKGGKGEVHWHHLNHLNNDTRIWNFVPLRASYNSELLARLEKKYLHHGDVGLTSYPARLSSDALHAQAELYSHEGLTGLAYGCARLAFWLIELNARSAGGMCLDRELCFKTAVQTLGFARNTCEPTLIEDVLHQDILPLTHSVMPADVVLRLIRELASILAEFDRRDWAGELFNRVHRPAQGRFGAGELVRLERRWAYNQDLRGHDVGLVRLLECEQPRPTQRVSNDIYIAYKLMSAGQEERAHELALSHISHWQKCWPHFPDTTISDISHTLLLGISLNESDRKYRRTNSDLIEWARLLFRRGNVRLTGEWPLAVIQIEEELAGKNLSAKKLLSKVQRTGLTPNAVDLIETLLRALLPMAPPR